MVLTIDRSENHRDQLLREHDNHEGKTNTVRETFVRRTVHWFTIRECYMPHSKLEIGDK